MAGYHELFSGVWPASTIPFNDDGNVLFDAFADHCVWLVDSGCRGVVFNGSLGEYEALSASERRRVVETAVVATTPESEMAAVAARLEGSLTGTIHFEPGDEGWARQMIETLARRVGRIIANGFPTGVRASTAMHHGGPFPATTASQYTSVGARAVDRFLRPVCLQDMPDDLVPDWARVS